VTPYNPAQLEAVRVIEDGVNGYVLAVYRYNTPDFSGDWDTMLVPHGLIAVDEALQDAGKNTRPR
jgi:hypothetical protein